MWENIWEDIILEIFEYNYRSPYIFFLFFFLNIIFSVFFYILKLKDKNEKLSIRNWTKYTINYFINDLKIFLIKDNNKNLRILNILIFIYILIISIWAFNTNYFSNLIFKLCLMEFLKLISDILRIFLRDDVTYISINFFILFKHIFINTFWLWVYFFFVFICRSLWFFLSILVFFVFLLILNVIFIFIDWINKNK